MAAIIVGPTNWQPVAAEEQQIQTASLGDQMLSGGYLICRSGGGTAWIVAPASSEVSRTWNSRNNANTVASACTLATGWFVPTCEQLKNPGYECRTYWDSYSSDQYWSSTQYNCSLATLLDFSTGCTCPCICINGVRCVRSFRCVTY